MKSHGIGRFVADPVLKKIPRENGETYVATFTLAVKEYRKSRGAKQEDASFFKFEVWDSAAELIAKKCKKGNLLYIEDATPRQKRWTDSETQQPRSEVYFRVNEFKLVSNFQSDENQETESE